MCFFQRFIFPCDHGIILWSKISPCLDAEKRSNPLREYKCSIRSTVGGFIDQHGHRCPKCVATDVTNNVGELGTGYRAPPIEPTMRNPIVRDFGAIDEPPRSFAALGNGKRRSMSSLSGQQTHVQPAPVLQNQYPGLFHDQHRPQEQPEQNPMKRKQIFAPSSRDCSVKRPLVHSSNADILQGGGGGKRIARIPIDQQQQHVTSRSWLSYLPSPESLRSIVQFEPPPPPPPPRPPPPLQYKQSFPFPPPPEYVYRDHTQPTKGQIFEDSMLDRMAKWDTGSGSSQTKGVDQEYAQMVFENTLKHEVTAYKEDMKKDQRRSKAALQLRVITQRAEAPFWAFYDHTTRLWGF